MRHIFLHPLFGHLTNSGTAIASCLAVAPPGALFQPGECRAQLTRGAPRDPAHDVARGHVRRGGDEDGPRILAHHPWQALDLEKLAGLPPHLSYTQGNIAGAHFVAVCGDPYAVILAVVNRMTAIALGHSSSTVAGCGGLL
jgi:hypothetical protein